MRVDPILLIVVILLGIAAAFLFGKARDIRKKKKHGEDN